MDNMYVELSKEKEKACLALENVKYSSCSFVTNPFAALLDNDATLGSNFGEGREVKSDVLLRHGHRCPDMFNFL